MIKTMALPKLGVNMTEAMITRWLVKPGDKVNEGESILEAETDKAVQQIPSTQTGIVMELLCSEGDTVQCHEAIITFIEEHRA